MLRENNDDWAVVRRYMTIEIREEEEPRALTAPKKHAAQSALDPDDATSTP